MAKFALRPIIFSIFACFLLLLVDPVYGSGNRERELSRADELIEMREFDEAILLLTDFARRNPGQFEEAQKRLRRIAQIRDEFNQTADELIYTLLEHPDEDEKIFELTRRLYTLENENNPLLVNYLSRTREIAAFNVYRNRLRSIMERGRDFLDSGDSVAAIFVYAEGLDFMREEFYFSGFGEEIENNVRRETDNLNSILVSFRQATELLNLISEEYITALNSGEVSIAPVSHVYDFAT